MNILVTMDAARINAGYTKKDASKELGVHFKTLERYEKDSSKLSFNMIEKVEKLYGIPKSNIFFGNKYQFINTIREKGTK